MLQKLYQCADGVQVTVMQARDAVRVTLDGHIYDLELVPSNDPGTKYTAGAVTWSLATDTGVLQDATDPSHPAILAKDCRQQSILPPSAPESASSPANRVEGTVSFVMPKGLPPDAEIRILLVDRDPRDAAHKYLASESFPILDRVPPIPFQLKFDPQRLRSRDCCALYAEIRVDHEPRYATARSQPVPDMSHPSPVKLELVALHKKAAQR